MEFMYRNTYSLIKKRPSQRLQYSIGRDAIIKVLIMAYVMHVRCKIIHSYIPLQLFIFIVLSSHGNAGMPC